jgi:hypothetical protein
MWGLAPVLLLVTLGPGGTSILWSFQSGYAIAVAAGLVGLILLEHGSSRSDALACVALLASLASASQGIGFFAGAAVMLVLRGDGLRRGWVVALPALLYVLWYLKYGHQASETHLSLWTTSLPYTVQGLSATIAPLLGLCVVSPVTGLLDPSFGQPLALAAIAVAVGARRAPRSYPRAEPLPPAGSSSAAPGSSITPTTPTTTPTTAPTAATSRPRGRLG